MLIDIITVNTKIFHVYYTMHLNSEIEFLVKKQVFIMYTFAIILKYSQLFENLSQFLCFVLLNFYNSIDPNHLPLKLISTTFGCYHTLSNLVLNYVMLFL